MSSVNLKLIFYVGKGNVADAAVRFWTKSTISHSEIQTIDGRFFSNDRNTRILRFARIVPNHTEWKVRVVALPIEIAKRLFAYQLRKSGTTYDWTGIVFSQIFKTGICAKKKWFCSKSNVDDILFALALMKSTNKNGKYDRFIHAFSLFEGVRPQNVSPATLYMLAGACEKKLRAQGLLGTRSY